MISIASKSVEIDDTLVSLIDLFWFLPISMIYIGRYICSSQNENWIHANSKFIDNFESCNWESKDQTFITVLFIKHLSLTFKAITLNTTLRDRRAHLCQFYIDRLWNENHPLHFMLPKQKEVVHNYNLRSGISRSTRPTVPVGPSARKSLSGISIPSGSYNYIF